MSWVHLLSWLPLLVFSSCVPWTLYIIGHSPSIQWREYIYVYYLSTQILIKKGIKKKACLALISSLLYVLKCLIYHTCMQKELWVACTLPSSLTSLPCSFCCPFQTWRDVFVHDFRRKAVIGERDQFTSVSDKETDKLCLHSCSLERSWDYLDYVWTML